MYIWNVTETNDTLGKYNWGGGGDSALHIYFYDNNLNYVKVYVFTIYYDIKTKSIDAGNPSQ